LEEVKNYSKKSKPQIDENDYFNDVKKISYFIKMEKSSAQNFNFVSRSSLTTYLAISAVKTAD
jgi:hypothetical protein